MIRQKTGCSVKEQLIHSYFILREGINIDIHVIKL